MDCVPELGGWDSLVIKFSFFFLKLACIGMILRSGAKLLAHALAYSSLFAMTIIVITGGIMVSWNRIKLWSIDRERDSRRKIHVEGRVCLIGGVSLCR